MAIGTIVRVLSGRNCIGRIGRIHRRIGSTSICGETRYWVAFHNGEIEDFYSWELTTLI